VNDAACATLEEALVEAKQVIDRVLSQYSRRARA
jgi:hypothetical protein